MADTMISLNIDLSSWDILYVFQNYYRATYKLL
jgi:hypothetical protein